MKNVVVGGLVMMLLLVGTATWWVRGRNLKQQQPQEVAENKVKVRREEDRIVVEVGERKMSMIDVKLRTTGGLSFTPNSQIFNSTLMNEDGAEGRRVILGVMKSTQELPGGGVVIGRIGGSSGKVEVEGTVTIAGEGELLPAEVKVDDGGGI